MPLHSLALEQTHDRERVLNYLWTAADPPYLELHEYRHLS